MTLAGRQQILTCLSAQMTAVGLGRRAAPVGWFLKKHRPLENVDISAEPSLISQETRLYRGRGMNGSCFAVWSDIIR